MTTTTTATEGRKVKRGFRGLRCICCGAVDAINVRLAEVAVLRCDDCGEDFTTADVRAHLTAWVQAIEWLESAPAIDGK